MNLEQIIQQSPIKFSDEEIEIIYNKNNKNTVDTLAELWLLEKIEKIELNEWDKRREIFDEYDKECYKFINKKKDKITSNILL